MGRKPDSEAVAAQAGRQCRPRPGRIMFLILRYQHPNAKSEPRRSCPVTGSKQTHNCSLLRPGSRPRASVTRQAEPARPTLVADTVRIEACSGLNTCSAESSAANRRPTRSSPGPIIRGLGQRLQTIRDTSRHPVCGSAKLHCKLSASAASFHLSIPSSHRLPGSISHYKRRAR